MRRIFLLLAIAGISIVILSSITSLPSAQAQQQQIFLLLERVTSLRIQVTNGPANSTVSFNVTQSNAGVLGYSLTSAGPFTETITVPVTLDANGNGFSNDFFVRGVTVGQSTYNSCSPQVGCTNTIDFTVVTVERVEFQAIDSPMDTNPNAGGGSRIFPDRQSAADTVNRRRIRIRATLSSPVAGFTVFFRSFDLDDPSTDASPVDPNSSNGDDNRGTPARGVLSQINTTGTSNILSAQTDANGVAEGDFTVTMQPGDNFMVAASHDVPFMNGLVVNGITLRDSAGNALPRPLGKASAMLTVWRRVHIEHDSMGNVAGNNVTGLVLSAVPNPALGRSDLVVNQALENGRFENGVISITGAGNFTVVTNTGGLVTVQGLVPVVPPTGTAFTIVDDDDFNSDDGTNRDGDSGENVTPAITTLLQDSDTPAQNVFALAYVRPIYDIGDNNDFVSFVLNSPTAAAGLRATYDFDTVGTAADAGFWTVYLLSAYQSEAAADADPSTEGAILGQVDDINGQGANVYNEVLRPGELTITAAVNNAATTAHEIGHLFNGMHTDGGLMAQSTTRTTTAFSDQTLARIRSISSP
ncbi:MAG TPA: hypothetical protein VIQ24_11880 [Pyrinomonadaceae bacterium]